ncbi:unnamed protein product, partial [Callosobruchus maculatus]
MDLRSLHDGIRPDPRLLGARFYGSHSIFLHPLLDSCAVECHSNTDILPVLWTRAGSLLDTDWPKCLDPIGRRTVRRHCCHRLCMLEIFSM